MPEIRVLEVSTMLYIVPRKFPDQEGLLNAVWTERAMHDTRSIRVCIYGGLEYSHTIGQAR